jgi:transposase-like protein
LAKVPPERVAEVAPTLKAIQAHESKEAAKEKAEKVIAKLLDKRLRSAAQNLKEGIDESLTNIAFPRNH